MEEVQWGPPLIVLAVGAVLGLLLVWRIRTGGGAAAAPALAADPEREDLEAQRDVLIRQLRELEDAPRDAPERVARERYRLELEAAEVLRRLDTRSATAPAAEAAPPAPASAGESPAADAAEPAPQSASALSGFLWGAGSMVAIGLLLFAVSRDAAERNEGGSVTGNVPGEGRAAAPPTAAPDAELAQLMAAVESDPDDLDARLALAQAHLMRQDLMSVFNDTQYVLERRPDDPRALSYQSLVRLAMGQPELAVQMLEKAIATEPDYLEAYVHLALVHTQTGNAEAAEAAVAEAARRHPDQAEMLERLLGEMRRASADAPPLPEGTHPDVAAPPPGAGRAAGGAPGPATAGAAAAAAGPGFSGTIRLDPAAGPVTPGSVIYVYVREAGYETGAPNAVKRLVAGSFPMSFRISGSDTMMGGELPESARIEARVDSDGDVSTRDPADPVAALDAVPIGSDDLELVLRAQP